MIDMKHIKKEELLRIIQKNVDDINKNSKYNISNIKYNIDKNVIQSKSGGVFSKILNYINLENEDIIENNDKLNINFDITQNFKGSYIKLKNINKTYNIDNISIESIDNLDKNINKILKDEINKFNFENDIQSKINIINKELAFVKNKDIYDISRITFKKLNDTYIIYGNTQNNSKIELLFIRGYNTNKDTLNELLNINNINKLSNDTIKGLKHSIINNRTDGEIVISPNQNVRVVTNTTIIESDSGPSITTNVEYILENKTRSIEHNQFLGQDQPAFFDLNYIFMLNQVEEIKEEAESEYTQSMNEIENEYENDARNRELEIINREELERLNKAQEEKDKEIEEKKKQEQIDKNINDILNTDDLVDFSAIDIL